MYSTFYIVHPIKYTLWVLMSFKSPNADARSFDTVLSKQMLGYLMKSYNLRVNGLINLSAETVIATIVYGS